jgi:type II secretory pathway pseudopilin PulG
MLSVLHKGSRSVDRRRAFTLTEIAIVLGVMGMILGAIWGAASTVYANKKTTSALQDILAIVANVRGLYTNGQIPGGAQILSAPLLNSGQIPSNMIGSCAGSAWGAVYGGTAGCIFDPWGTQIVVGSQEGWWGVPAKSNAFEIDFYNLTNAQCAAFAMQLIQQAAANGLATFYSDTTGVIQILPTTSPTVVQNCSGAVNIQFTL